NLSHSILVRGLKFYLVHNDLSYFVVALYMGAWIEIAPASCKSYSILSHSIRVRELKYKVYYFDQDSFKQLLQSISYRMQELFFYYLSFAKSSFNKFSRVIFIIFL